MRSAHIDSVSSARLGRKTEAGGESIAQGQCVNSRDRRQSSCAYLTEEEEDASATSGLANDESPDQLVFAD